MDTDTNMDTNMDKNLIVPLGGEAINPVDAVGHDIETHGVSHDTFSPTSLMNTTVGMKY